MLKISRSIFLILLINVYLISGCSSENSTQTFPVVVFSDVHFNPFYDPTLFQSLVTTDANKWEAVFQSSTVTTLPASPNDTNYPLFVLSLASIKQNLRSSPFIIFTGDILGHHFSQLFYQNYYANLGRPVPANPDPAAVTAMQAFANKTVAYFSGQVRLTAGNIPVLFAVGNNDSYADLGPDSTFLSGTAETFYTNFVNGTVDHQTFLATYKQGGYYSAALPNTNLMVVGLNTIPFMPTPALGDTSAAVAAQLAWLDATLASAQANGKKVWLLLHTPPGADIYKTSGTADSNGHITTPTMMWKPEYQTSFLQIFAKYSDVIAMSLAGHTHMDEYRIMSSSAVLDITPSISPRSGNDPAYRVFTFFSDTYIATDFQSINYNLAAKPVQFNAYYTFSSAYSVQGLLNDSLALLFPALNTNNPKQLVYRGLYYSGNNASNPITDTNWPFYWCGTGYVEQQAFTNCVNNF